MSDMNQLEKALLDDSGMALQWYLDDTGTMQVMRDIEEIRKKAAMSTDAGVLRERVLAALETDETPRG